MSNNLFFLAGFQKCATTWLHRCLEEHPQIFVPNVDMVHYYDMNYHRGRDWYEKFYQSYNQEQMRGDTTVSYARSELAIKRIAKTNSNAKIILSLRNPITRAFSHYWHEKKKGKIQFGFQEIFENYDLFSDWIETGFYSIAIKRVKKYFSEVKLYILLFDDIEADPKTAIQKFYEFLCVDSDFEPTYLTKKVNVALQYVPVPFSHITISKKIKKMLPCLSWKNIKFLL